MLYTVQQLRDIEQRAPGPLMPVAGEVAAQSALRLLSAKKQSVLVVAGPGNNGGDAMETAVHLVSAGHKVALLHHPAATMSPDTERAFKLAKACWPISWLATDATLTNDYALVVDGLFGIGLNSRPLSASLQTQIEAINAMTCPILALDIPSGLNADTGNLTFNIAIRATHTITFIGDKPGLHTADGRDYAGIVEVADLGIAQNFYPASDTQLNSTALFAELLQPRRHNSNKGNFGTVSIVGGATGMQGAVILAARAALFSGAGRVVAGFVDGFAESAPHYDALQPEIMCRSAESIAMQQSTAVVIGPGMGNSNVELLKQALLAKTLLILDADALNLIAEHPELDPLCSGTLLTPHPLEAARLLGCTVTDIQTDRLAAARKLAGKLAAVVILKGSGTIIAHPDGRIVINTTGNAGLASGGTGDVLAGVCGALAAQYKDLWISALAATYLHGAAADNLVARGIGPVGLCASELANEIRKIVNLPVTVL